MHSNSYRQLYKTIFCIAFSFSATSGSDAQEKPPVQQGRSVKTTQMRAVVLPGTNYEIATGRSISFTDPGGEALLTAIVTWLSANYDLPAVNQHPRIEFVTSLKMTTLRYRQHDLSPTTPTPPDNRDATLLRGDHDIVALYDNAIKTIYLPEGWTGKTPAELSVIAHEMVHHLQNVAGLKYGCPEEREKPAYAAQARWLGLFGQSLATEFQMDPFTVFARTSCLG